MTRQYVTFYEDELKAKQPRIVSIQTNLTNVCPQHCIMCNKPEWAKIQKGRDAALDPEHTAQELNSLPYLETVVLSGGDPMNYRHLKEYLSAIKEPIKFGMFTTGLDNAINRYPDLPLERFGYIRFSIDGATPETWASIRGSVPRAYSVAWQNVVDTSGSFKRMFGQVQGKEKVRVQFTIQDKNIRELPTMMDKCFRHDIPIYGYWVHDYQVVKPEDVDWLRKTLAYMMNGAFGSWARQWTNAEDIIQTGDKVPMKIDPKDCVIPYVHAFIDTDGSVFTCCYLVGDNLPFDQRDMKYSYGNIYDTPLADILSKTNVERIAALHINSANEICSSCMAAKSRYYKVNLEAIQLQERRPTFL